ncbi:DNA-directed RNA polymerases IV and V subunit 4 isoform X2 [Daucus carota subsp. sativus]|nr:PREDICTED: DNA-directed RNA polymerases IV and V subunit 4-like isoform X2 [Daucus carota subsp. sativus]XP_017249911.1 PREDICTED: DNA-directed RNA polymerases IV and V subunit 4-like isoform X2 [Daucus carota subsp. sativus]
MNVQFEFEDRGGKRDKAANGGKNPVKKPTPPLQLRVEQELPENVTCLMDCEAAQVLEGIQEQMVVLSEDPAIKIPASFDKGLQRAKRGNNYTSLQSVQEVLQNLKKHGVADSELCLIANIHPESADEVFSLVPSLKGKKNKLLEPLNSALDELSKIECSA